VEQGNYLLRGGKHHDKRRSVTMKNICTVLLIVFKATILINKELALNVDVGGIATTLTAAVARAHL
jgi:hypothetical protein